MNTRHILMAAIALPVLALTGCDTTEEGFHPGNRNDIKLGVASTTLEFAASKGSTAILGITGNCKWTIDCNDSHFSFSQKSGEGSTDVTVQTTDGNPDKPYTISFDLIAVDTEGLNLNQQITLTQQAAQISDRLTPSFTSYPEEGGEQEIEVMCSVDWVFNVEGTEESKSAFHISPQSGFGTSREFSVVMKFDPNYTQQERVVSVTFDPSKSSDLAVLQNHLPPAITLTQAVGTLPTNLVMALGTPTSYDCQVSLKFESKAPIEQCGVILNGTETIVAPLASPDSREVTWTMTGLSEGTRYNVVPFVTSKVGKTEGNSVELHMDGTKITDVAYDVDVFNVTASVSFDSTTPVTNVGLDIYNESNSNSPFATFTSDAFSLREGTRSVSTTDSLIPNTDYEVRPFIRYTDLEGQSKVLYYDRIKIHTKSQTPSTDDNTPIQ